MWHNIRTSQDTKYCSGDLVYYKQKDNNYWKGPGTVIGQDGQQVLVKHSSSYVRVHPCQLQLINNMKENELDRSWKLGIVIRAHLVKVYNNYASTLIIYQVNFFSYSLFHVDTNFLFTNLQILLWI